MKSEYNFNKIFNIFLLKELFSGIFISDLFLYESFGDLNSELILSSIYNFLFDSNGDSILYIIFLNDNYIEYPLYLLQVYLWIYYYYHLYLNYFF